MEINTLSRQEKEVDQQFLKLDDNSWKISSSKICLNSEEATRYEWDSRLKCHSTAAAFHQHIIKRKLASWNWNLHN